jgi:hypothetical protein
MTWLLLVWLTNGVNFIEPKIDRATCETNAVDLKAQFSNTARVIVCVPGDAPMVFMPYVESALE